MPWVREGECPPERCQGRCCTHIGSWVPASEENDDYVEVLRARGVAVHRVGMMWLTDIQQRCQWLSDEGLCRLHPAMNPSENLPERPQFCEDWPVDPSQTLTDPYCGYTFRWVDAAGAAE